MRLIALASALFGLIVTAPHAVAAKAPLVTTAKVPALTRMLEAEPNGEMAPVIRGLLLEWEDKTKDVVDWVCPNVMDPVPEPTVPNGPELLAQFIFGSASFQIENPSRKGELQPSQLAGMRSMLKAYSSFLAADSKARIPRFDSLIEKDHVGELQSYLEPLVAPCGESK